MASLGGKVSPASRKKKCARGPPSLEMSNTPPHPWDCETPVEGPYSVIRTGMRAGSRVIRNKRYMTAYKYFYGPWSNQVCSLDLKDVEASDTEGRK